MLMRCFTFYLLLTLLSSCRLYDDTSITTDRVLVNIIGVVEDELLQSQIKDKTAYCTLSILQNDDKNNSEKERLSFYLPSGLNNQEKISLANISLPIGNYAILIWIDYRDQEELSYYDLSSLRAVTMHKSLDAEDKECYAGCVEVKINGCREEVDVYADLYNPLANYVVLINEFKNTDSQTVFMTCTGFYPTSYDVMTAQCVSAQRNYQSQHVINKRNNENIVLAEDCMFSDKKEISFIPFNILIGNKTGNIAYQQRAVPIKVQQGHKLETLLNIQEFLDSEKENIIDNTHAGEIDVKVDI